VSGRFQFGKLNDGHVLVRQIRFPVYLRHLCEYFMLYTGLALLGIACLLWALVAFPLNLVLPGVRGIWIGRWVATLWFHVYLSVLSFVGAARFDLRELDALRGAGPLIIAANHPGLLDAPMVLSRLPNVACVLKSSLIDSVFWGAAARLAGYIRNDWFVGSVKLAVEELHRGGQILVFPEGTRTEGASLGEFRLGPAYVSSRSGFPIQTIFIEQDTDFLGKGQPLLKRPDLPMHFRIRMGKRFDSPSDPRAFTITLREYFESELRSSSLGA
jgi:1-acyl-sn-glycerol-3-phosphate acyltransferase